MSRNFRFLNLAARQTITRRGVATPSVDPAAVRKSAEGVVSKLTGAWLRKNKRCFMNKPN